MKKIITAVLTLALAIGPAASTFAYTVKEGDTMWGIAESHDMSLDRLIEMNPSIEDPNMIYIGNEIVTTTNITKEERELMAKLVYCEARGEPFAGKVKVAKVVLNRVDSPDFPDSIKEVIYQDGQFTPATTGAVKDANSTKEAYKAVDKAVATYKNGDGSLYFFNPDVADAPWLENLQTTTVIGEHVFKK